MAKKIYCAVCDKYLGKIIKGNLYKYTTYLCDTCFNNREQKKPPEEYPKGDFMDFFNDIVNKGG